MSAPRPGRAVRGSRTGRPIMAALDLLGRRWSLRVLWELRDGSPASFRTLRERCDGMSASVLNQRLADLKEAGLVNTGPGGYSLTKRGAELQDALAPLDAWAKRWGASPQGEGSARKSAAGRRATPPPAGSTPRDRRAAPNGTAQ
jgi:DNA-binding HxlR family transcriptional regulator